MKTASLVTVAVGLTAIVTRVVAPGSLADLIAVGYLFAATSAFGPRLNLIARQARP